MKTRQRNAQTASVGRHRFMVCVLIVFAVWALKVVPLFVFKHAHITFANPPLARWLIPCACIAAAAGIAACRWREWRARNCLSPLPETHRKPWWQKRLGRLGRLTYTVTAVHCLQVAALLTVSATLAGLVAEPVLGERPYRVRANQLRLLVLIDESLSLNAEDCEGLPLVEDEPFGPHNSRIQLVQLSMDKVLGETPGNGVAMGVYASQGLMLQPRFVYNHAPLWYEIKVLKAGAVPGGTRSDIANGFQTAMDFIEKDKKTSADQKYMILLFSDGGFSADAGQKDTPQERLARELARVNKNGVSLVIGGLGSDSPVPVPQYQRNQEGFLTKVGDLKIGGRPALTVRNQAVLDDIHRQVPGSQLLRLRSPDDLRIAWDDALGEEHMEVDAAPASQLLAAVAGLALAMRLFLT